MSSVFHRGAAGGRFTWLLVSLLLLSVAGAFLSDSRMGLALNNILLGLTLVTSIYPVSQNKSFVWIGGVFASAFVQ